MVPSDTKNQSDQNKTFRDVLGGLWVLGRMFGHEFHALVIFQKFLIADDFAALFGFGSVQPRFRNLTPPQRRAVEFIGKKDKPYLNKLA